VAPIIGQPSRARDIRRRSRVAERYTQTASSLFARTRFGRAAIDHADRVLEQDFLVCLCRGFASLWGIILCNDGVIDPRQHRYQQYRYCHPKLSSPLKMPKGGWNSGGPISAVATSITRNCSPTAAGQGNGCHVESATQRRALGPKTSASAGRSPHSLSCVSLYPAPLALRPPVCILTGFGF